MAFLRDIITSNLNITKKTMTKTVGFLSLERVGGCCEPMARISNDPSLLSRRTERFIE